jgi:hypothetical protein
MMPTSLLADASKLYRQSNDTTFLFQLKTAVRSQSLQTADGGFTP